MEPQKVSFAIQTSGIPGAGPLFFNMSFGSLTLTKGFKINKITCFPWYANLAQFFLLQACRLTFTSNPQQVLLDGVPQGTAVGGAGAIPTALNLDFTPDNTELRFDNFIIPGALNVGITAQVWNNVAFAAPDTVTVDILIEGEYL